VAAITVDVARVRPVRFTNDDFDSAPAGVASLAAGTVVTKNPAAGADAGKWIAGNGGTNGRQWILLRRVTFKNQEVTAQRAGLVDIGAGLAAKNEGDVVYSTPAGGLDDVVTSNKRIGVVALAFGENPPSRLLALDG
jgi:predicted transcriptional regulator